jgi:hypothetical protein
MWWLLSLILAIPVGLFLASLTRDETTIYKRMPYFPLIIPLVFILSLIAFINRHEAAKPLLFTYLTLMCWCHEATVKRLLKGLLSKNS